MDKARALERERERLALVRERRRARDERRRDEAVLAADEAQRRPWLLRVAAAMAARCAELRRLEHAHREFERQEQAWSELGLTDPQIRQAWAKLGVTQAARIRPAAIALGLALDNYQEPRALLARSSTILHWMQTEADVAGALRALKARSMVDQAEILAELLLSDLVYIRADEAERLVALVSTEPGDPRYLSELNTSGELGWDAWIIASRIHAGSRSGALGAALVNSVDDRVLDDLVSSEPQQLLRLAEFLSADRAAYIRARLAPELLEDDEVRCLGLADEWARRLIAGVPGEPLGETSQTMAGLLKLTLGENDDSAIAVLASCDSAPLRRLAVELRELGQIGVVGGQLVEDTSLWPTIERILGPRSEHFVTPVAEPDQGEAGDGTLEDDDVSARDRLRAWIALRLTYRWMLEGVTGDQRHRVERMRLSIPHPLKHHRAELLTAEAYIASTYGELTPAVRCARAAHELVANTATEKNLARVMKATSGRLSPHLLVGVDSHHPDPIGAADRAYRRHFRNGPDALAPINWARDALSAGSEFFTYPVRPHLYAAPETGLGALRPAPVPLRRQSLAVDLAHLAELREAAAGGLVEAALRHARFRSGSA